VTDAACRALPGKNEPLAELAMICVPCRGFPGESDRGGQIDPAAHPRSEHI
jgi:hypothetical protein